MHHGVVPCLQRCRVPPVLPLAECHCSCTNHMQGPTSSRGWGALLSAAFRGIRTLNLSEWGFQLDIELLAGLSACHRLTELHLQCADLLPEVVDQAHLLPGWLPHVHTLTCRAGPRSLALVRGLAGQLQHVVLTGQHSADVAAALAVCTQLVSISLWDLTQPVLDALTPLQHLRQVTVKFGLSLSSRNPAQWGVTTLSVLTLPIDQVLCLPLASVHKLTVRGDFTFRLKPTPAESAALMREACSALAQVPQLESRGVDLYIWNTGPDRADVLVPPAEVPPHMEGVLAGLQPVAAKLGSSFRLRLAFLDGQAGNNEVLQQQGPEVLRGLHAAFGDRLTQLTIEAAIEWSPGASFWESLPGVLPQLRQLELLRVSGFSHVCATAMGMACTRLQMSGRQFELKFYEPYQIEDEVSQVVSLLQVLQPHVNVWIERDDEEL